MESSILSDTTQKGEYHVTSHMWNIRIKSTEVRVLITKKQEEERGKKRGRETG